MAHRARLSPLVIGFAAICMIALLVAVAIPMTVIAQSGDPVDPASTSAEAAPDPSEQSARAALGPEKVDATLTSWRVTGSALKPRDNNVDFATNTTGACQFVTGGNAATVWNVPVLIPNGATVNLLRMYYYDTSASTTNAWFTVYDLYGSVVHEWIVASSGSAGNGYRDSAVINHTVDYGNYSYLINWRPVASGATMQVCGFRVFYEAPPFGASYLPAIRK